MLTLAFAWTELSSKSALTARNVSERRPILYAVTRRFIAQLRDEVYKDHFFVAHLYEQTHVERIIAAALDAWSLNTPGVEIIMTPNATRADILFQGTYAALEPNVIANWKHPVIQVSKDRCWYEQRAWCPFFAQNMLTVNIMLSMLCAFLSLPALRFYVQKTGTRAAYVSSFATSLCALIWFVEIAPCLFCFELQTVIMHEVGHALGVGHSTAAQQRRCGCSSVALLGNRTCDFVKPVMSLRFNARTKTCLSDDDIDAVRSLWRSDCNATNLCEPAPHGETVVIRRFFVAVYAYLAATVFVFLAKRCRSANRREEGSNGRGQHGQGFAQHLPGRN